MENKRNVSSDENTELQKEYVPNDTPDKNNVKEEKNDGFRNCFLEH